MRNCEETKVNIRYCLQCADCYNVNEIPLDGFCSLRCRELFKKTPDFTFGTLEYDYWKNLKRQAYPHFLKGLWCEGRYV